MTPTTFFQEGSAVPETQFQTRYGLRSNHQCSNYCLTIVEWLRENVMSLLQRPSDSRKGYDL